jgi:hypothetical protein
VEIHSNTLNDSDIEISVIVTPSIFDRLGLDRFLPAPASQETQVIYYAKLIIGSILAIVMTFLLIFILVGINESNVLLKEQSRILEEQRRVLERQNIILSIDKTK